MEHMKIEFQTSMVGELSFLLGFQIRHCKTGIFLPQEKYARNIIQKFGLEKLKIKRTLVTTHLKVSQDNHGKGVDGSLQSKYYRKSIVSNSQSF